jgi:type IX secretion system PorP/SprF family membrane protein
MKMKLFSAFVQKYQLIISNIFLFIFLVLYSFNAAAQDIHYAQFMYSPLNLNPAQTGLFNGDYRFAANHRQQWNSVTVPYKTYSASFDMNIEKLSNERNRANCGLILNSDKAGDSHFGTLEAELSFSWHRYIDADSQQTISGGLQTGVVQRSIDYNSLTFDNQFNGDVFDPSISPGEDFQVSRFYYFNFSAGAAWRFRVNHENSIGAGFSVQHINKPRQSFFENKSVRLPMRFQLDVNGEIKLSDHIRLIPDVIWMRQNTFSELTGGGQIKFSLSEKPGKQYALYLGVEGRLKDALIPMAGLDYNALHIGVSYDVNTSGLKRASNGKGGLELALIYIITKVKSTGIKPPCVIY